MGDDDDAGVHGLLEDGFDGSGVDGDDADGVDALAMRSWMTWACMVASVSAGPFWKTFIPVSEAYLLTPVSIRTNHGFVASLGTTAIV